MSDPNELPGNRAFGRWSNPGMDITGKTAPEPEAEPEPEEDDHEGS